MGGPFPCSVAPSPALGKAGNPGGLDRLASVSVTSRKVGGPFFAPSRKVGGPFFASLLCAEGATQSLQPHFDQSHSIAPGQIAHSRHPLSSFVQRSMGGPNGTVTRFLPRSRPCPSFVWATPSKAHPFSPTFCRFFWPVRTALLQADPIRYRGDDGGKKKPHGGGFSPNTQASPDQLRICDLLDTPENRSTPPSCPVDLPEPAMLAGCQVYG